NHLWVFNFLLNKPKTENFGGKKCFFLVFVIKFCK
ncbi:unnamed protein product, partial [Staurois parvus]